MKELVIRNLRSCHPERSKFSLAKICGVEGSHVV